MNGDGTGLELELSKSAFVFFTTLGRRFDAGDGPGGGGGTIVEDGTVLTGLDRVKHGVPGRGGEDTRRVSIAFFPDKWGRSQLSLAGACVENFFTNRGRRRPVGVDCSGGNGGDI